MLMCLLLCICRPDVTPYLQFTLSAPSYLSFAPSLFCLCTPMPSSLLLPPSDGFSPLFSFPFPPLLIPLSSSLQHAVQSISWPLPPALHPSLNPSVPSVVPLTPQSTPLYLHTSCILFKSVASDIVHVHSFLFLFLFFLFISLVNVNIYKPFSSKRPFFPSELLIMHFPNSPPPPTFSLSFVSPSSLLLPCNNPSSPSPSLSPPVHLLSSCSPPYFISPFLPFTSRVSSLLTSLRGGYGMRGRNSVTRVSIFNINGRIGPFTPALTHSYGHTRARCQIKSDQRLCKVLRCSPQDRRLVDTHTHTHNTDVHLPMERPALQDGCGIIRQRSVAVLSRNGRAGGAHQSSTARSLRHCFSLTQAERRRGSERRTRAASIFVQTYIRTPWAS